MTVNELMNVLKKMDPRHKVVLQPEGPETDLVNMNLVEEVWLPDKEIVVLLDRTSHDWVR
jgi:hypothetical protein